MLLRGGAEKVEERYKNKLHLQCGVCLFNGNSPLCNDIVVFSTLKFEVHGGGGGRYIDEHAWVVIYTPPHEKVRNKQQLGKLPLAIPQSHGWLHP